MAELKIRVTAAADPSIKMAFRPIEEAAERARQVVARSGQQAERSQQRGAVSAERAAARTAAADKRAADARVREQARTTARLERELAKLSQAEQRAAQRSAREAERAAQQKTRATMREFDQRLRAAQRAYQAEEREILRVGKAAERADRRKAQRPREDVGPLRESLAKRAAADVGRLGRAAFDLSRDVAMGAGVDFSIGGSVGRSVDLQRQATLLSLQSRREGSTEQLSAEEVSAQIRSGATEAGYSYEAAARGAAAFTQKTGDVATGLRLLRELGPLAQATGTDLDHLVSAAGEVSNALGDMKGEERIKAISEVLRQFTAQGFEGSVEISDLATQASKLGAAAGQIGGNRAETLGELGALIQVARAKGGATSAEEAGTTISNFINTLKTKARRAHFADAGVEIEDPTTGLLRSPRAIIEDAVLAADTDTSKFKSMFANVSGARTVEGFRAEYLEARSKAKEGGASDDEAREAGRKAIRALFDSFSGAKLDDSKVKAMFAEREGNADVRAQRFQNKLDDLGAKLGDTMLPALEKLTPQILAAGEAFAKVVAWAADNPGKAITAAIVGSIVKAKLGDVLSDGLKNILSGGGAGRGAPGAGVGPGAGAVGVVVAGAAGFLAGKEIIEAAGAEGDAADLASRGRTNESENIRHEVAMRVRAGEVTPEDAQRLLDARSELQTRIREAESVRELGSSITGGLSGALNFVSGGSAGTSFDRQNATHADAKNLDQLRAQLDALNGTMLQMLAAARDKNVFVENMPNVLVEQAGRASDFVGGFFGIGGGR